MSEIQDQIDKLKKLNLGENLIDCYSAEWNSKKLNAPLEKWQIPASEMITPLKDLDDEYGPEYHHHLYFLFIDPYDKEAHKNHKNICDVFPELSDLILTDKHLPNFIIINTKVEKILCIGLGRKNRIFIIDAKTKKSIDFDSANSTAPSGSRNADYVAEFTKLDHDHLVEDLISNLDLTGSSFYEEDHMPIDNQDVAYELLDEPVNEDGKIVHEDDGEEYTKEEIEEIIKEYDKLHDDQDGYMKVINFFFPQCEPGDLNTGDY